MAPLPLPCVSRRPALTGPPRVVMEIVATHDPHKCGASMGMQRKAVSCHRVRCPSVARGSGRAVPVRLGGREFDGFLRRSNVSGNGGALHGRGPDLDGLGLDIDRHAAGDPQSRPSASVTLR